MRDLNLKAKILLIVLLASSILLPIIANILNTFFIPAIVISICIVGFIVFFIIMTINTAKFIKQLERENEEAMIDFNAKKSNDGKMVNLTYKEYVFLLKHGFVATGKDKTEIIELDRERYGNNRQKQ